MMNGTLICDELCELDLAVDSTEEFFNVMSEKAKLLGYVTESFLPAIKKREQEYPTALPVEPYPVAIPHSDRSRQYCKAVYRSCPIKTSNKLV